MSTNEHEMNASGFQPPSNQSEDDRQNDLEIKAAHSELKRINLQIEGLTDKINALTDARNQAYGYERSLKTALELRLAKQR